MAKDGSRKNTGDPLRDAIIARGKMAQDVRDEIYENALAREKMALAAYDSSTGTVATWTPPTEEQFNHDWIRPETALEIVTPGIHGNDATVARRWFVDRLKAGLIVAVARTFELKGTHSSYFPVNRVFFEEWGEYGDAHWWKTGDAIFHMREYLVRVFDVRLDPKTISSSSPKASPAQIGPVLLAPMVPSKGGARRKGWWDDLWIEMIRRIRADELHPESGKQLERIMLDWLGERGIYPGEETLKKTALKLFKYLQE